MTSFKKARIYRENKESKIPTRAHNLDAGADIYYNPQDDVSITIPPHSSALLPSGVKIEVPSGCMLQIMNKSGIAFKKSLIVGACVVDEGYTGEIFVNLHNVGKESQSIAPGQKIAQAVFVRIARPLLTEIENEQIYDHAPTRGSGALGSTGDY